MFNYFRNAILFGALLLLLLLLCLPKAYADPPTNGLVGYWNFDEGSGGAVNDSSGGLNHGTIVDATWTGWACNPCRKSR